MWQAVELRELRVFLTLADELHFGRAAERLQIDRSRVSQIINGLETKLGGQLFARTSRRVTLTPIGEQFRAKLQPVYSQLHEVIEQTRTAVSGVTGHLRVGTYMRVLLGPHWSEIVEAFENRHPGCRVTFIDTGLDRDYLDWLREGEVDVVVCWLPVSPPEFAVGPIIQRDDRILIVARDHPLARQDAVTIEDLADYPVNDVPAFNREMMNAFIPPVTPSGKRLRRVAPATAEETITRVAHGDQVHPSVRRFFEYFKDPQLTVVPFSDLPPAEAALVWRTVDRRPKIRAFAVAAEEVLNEHRGRTQT